MLPPPSPHALAIARDLIGMNTVSDRSNLALIGYVHDALAALGVRSRLTYNADRTKANLFATLGEGKPAGVILSGHTDTVPWDGQDWSRDPLDAALVDDAPQGPSLYGRGSCDMKGFIALALANAERFLHGSAPFAIHFAFSYDEEVGCFGVRELIADLRDAGIRPLACIVGEPTSMVPAIAHKGVFRYQCCVRGREAHSSLTPQSVNAVEHAALLVAHLRGMAGRFEREESRFAVAGLPDARFDVPFSTMSVGQFHGGIADNVVPRDAYFRYEFRNLPTSDAILMQKEVIAQADTTQYAMKNIAPEAGIRFETICEIPAFSSSPDSPATRLALRLSGAARPTLVAFGTEAGLFTGAGIPTVVCGPGSIEQAHRPDEYVTLDQLARCDAFLQALAQAEVPELAIAATDAATGTAAAAATVMTA